MKNQYVEKLLALLRIKPVVAGIEIDDAVIRLAFFDGKLWRLNAVRLEPGVVEQGIVKNEAAFIAALGRLKAESGIVPGKQSKNISVAVALSSVSPFNKVFSLPVIEGEDLDRAATLNMEMASPKDAAQVYSDWEVVGRDADRGKVEVLASFIDRAPVDSVVDALYRAGFTAMAVESKSLALTRVFRENGSGVDISKPYILVSMDDAGLDFLVVKNGRPYFEYANPWRDISDTKGMVSLDALNEELAMSLRQVLNFYAQHWAEPLAAVILSTVALQDEIERVVAETAAIPAVRLSLVMGQPISPEWLPALGASLHGKDLGSVVQREISFLGEELAARSHEEQMIRFLGFWQAVVPVSFGILVAVFLATDIWLGGAKTTIESESSFLLVPQQSSAVNALEASSTAFNAEVAAIQAVESQSHPSYQIMDDVQKAAAASGITISRFTYTNNNAPLTLSGIASSQNNIITFKDALAGNPHISGINLPLTGIQPAAGNYSFSVTFGYRE